MNEPARFQVHEIAPTLRVRLAGAMLALPAAVDRRVEALWQAAIDRVAAGGAGRLFNGRVFSADTITPTLITGHMTEFRRIVAQMDDPTLGRDLNIRPLAVCGVLTGPDGVVIGRRPPGAVYQPDMWQLPPAGSVDQGALRPDGSIDLTGQLLAELTEELGLPADAVAIQGPLCAVEHEGSRVTDLGIAVATSLSAAAIREAHRTNGNAEYDPLLIVPRHDIAGFVERERRHLVSPAREFLFRLGWLDHGLSPPTGP